MKKTSKLLSALLLLGQVVGYTPTVLASEEQPKIPTEESVEHSSNEGVNEETSDQPTTSTEETTETSDDTLPVAPPIESKPENGTTSSSESENHSPEETNPSETLPTEKPDTKPNESTNQAVTKPTKPVEEVSQNQKLQEKSQATTGQATQITGQNEQKTESAEVIQEEPKNYHQSPSAPISELVPSSTQDNAGNIHFEKDESVETFIRKIGESARKIGQENDLYASVMIAQAILESASGQSKLAQAPNYNLFGIKGTHNGKGVSFATQEDLGDGTLYTTHATFRQYENYEDSLNDYAQLLKEGLIGNSRFYDGVWKTNAKTYQEATKFLTGRYATDTSYDKKLNGLIEIYDLTKYDKEVIGPKLSKEGYIVPVKNYTISSTFGIRENEFHRGIDLAVAQGEPIYASKAGTVIKAEFHPSWGNVVAIEHEDGTTALYAHQQEYQVKVGDKVEQGQIIGYVGSTGNSTGSHLHFELCLDHSLNQSRLVDPETVLF